MLVELLRCDVPAAEAALSLMSLKMVRKARWVERLHRRPMIFFTLIAAACRSDSAAGMLVSTVSRKSVTTWPGSSTAW